MTSGTDRPGPQPGLDPADHGDVAALLELRDALARWLWKRGIAQWQEGEFGAERLRTWIDAGWVHVLRRDDRIAAAVTVLWEDPDIWGPAQPPAGYVHLLMVDRDHAGRGLGEWTLTWAEGHIAATGRRLVRLDAAADNPRLQRWYADRGYREVGHREFADGAWFAVTLREKRLV